MGWFSSFWVTVALAVWFLKWHASYLGFHRLTFSLRCRDLQTSTAEIIKSGTLAAEDPSTHRCPASIRSALHKGERTHTSKYHMLLMIPVISQSRPLYLKPYIHAAFISISRITFRELVLGLEVLWGVGFRERKQRFQRYSNRKEKKPPHNSCGSSSSLITCGNETAD